MKIPSLAVIQEMMLKPYVWLLAVMCLCGTAAILFAAGNDSWSDFGAFAIFAGLFGRLWTAGPMYGGEKWARSSLWMIGAFIFFPVIAHQLRRDSEGRPATILGHMIGLGEALATDVTRNLASEPPLKVRVDHRTAFLGLIRTDFLIVKNLDEKGVFPMSCRLTSGSNMYEVVAPEVFKPYDTVEVELKTTREKLHFNKGDAVIIECKGFLKPLILLAE